LRHDMSFTWQEQISKGIPLEGGLRKRCFLVKEGREKLVYSLWPTDSLSEEKIKQTIKWELMARARGVPARHWQKLDGSWLKKIRFERKIYWLGIGNYLPGQIYYDLAPGQLYAAGRKLAFLHQSFRRLNNKTLLHLDFARGNLLFNKKKEVAGILDFEEAGWGIVEKDLACSLSFFVVDNGQLADNQIWGNFLKGYTDGGGDFNYDKIKRFYFHYLKVRAEENNQKAFLLLARERLRKIQERIKAKLLKKTDLEQFLKKHQDKRIVFLVGAFELLHWGHLKFLKKAKSLGDTLVVGVASDQSRRRLKGEPYPLISERTRAETLAYFDSVDAVVIVTEDSVRKELQYLKPKIFYAIADDWKQGIRKMEEAESVRSWGGKVIKTLYLSPRISSSQMTEKVALLKIKQVLFGKKIRQPMLKLRKNRRIPKEVKFPDLEKLEKRLHQQNKTIVFASLTADLFHLGHARFIQKAKSLADFLVIGVPSNESVTALKGPGRPIIDERARALVLSELNFVNKVVIFDERTVFGCLQKLKPDVFFTVKEDWNTGLLSSPEAHLVRSYGGKIARSERQAPYLSASKMIDKAAGEIIQKKFSALIKTAAETPILDADGFDPHHPQVQLAAREKGFYDQVLASVAKRGKCVFCDLKEKYIIASRDGIVLTVALFPYIDGHLLVIPRRHLLTIDQLNPGEISMIFDMVGRGKKILNQGLGIENYWIILREGNGIKAGKSVDHLHFHLIPYNSTVVKMGNKKLTSTPLKMAQTLKKQWKNI